jgi:GntR family transcriptional regulator
MGRARDEHDRLVADLTRMIRERALRPGERLGSERELAEHLGVTRSTLRGALESLEAADSIRRVMGRSGGVYASDGRIERRLNTIEGVPSMLRQQGIRSHTEVLSVTLGVATPPEMRALALGRGGRVVRIVRRRDAGGTPWSLDTSVLPAALVPGIGALDLRDSLYGLLAERYDLVAAEAEETIDIVPAADEIARHLDIAESASVLQVWRTTRTADDRIFEYAHDYFRADRTRVHLQRYGQRWKRVRDAG